LYSSRFKETCVGSWAHPVVSTTVARMLRLIRRDFLMNAAFSFYDITSGSLLRKASRELERPDSRIERT
jgi:hypothetical protein